MFAIRFASLLLAAALSAGCAGSLLGINLFVVDEKTALEQQVLGTYESIGTDLSSYGSVRGVNPDGSINPPPPMTDSQREVMRAMNNRRYNRDDVNLMLQEGIVGEGSDGLLVILADPIPAAGGLTPTLAREVINEENNDRRTILERLMQTTPGVTEADRPEVQRIFATLNRDLAPAGARIQQADGGWSVK